MQTLISIDPPLRNPAADGDRRELPERLIDTHGRVVKNIRLSITDRCNFRCVYCMPEEMEFFPREHILTYEEIIRLTRIAAGLGVDKVRLTGGGPRVRRDLPKLVRGLCYLGVLSNLSPTTNGVR